MKEALICARKDQIISHPNNYRAASGGTSFSEARVSRLDWIVLFMPELSVLGKIIPKFLCGRAHPNGFAAAGA